jgi:CHASE2 domain-containing sensor protein
LAHVLSTPAIVSVLMIVLVFNLVVESEAVQENLPIIRRTQLAVHRLLCSLLPRDVAPKWVRAVEIDDQAHQRLGEPTNRAYLASLVRNAAAGDALAIVLDIKLLAPINKADGEDDPERAGDNAALAGAITDAAGAGVPVVVTSWLGFKDGRFFLKPNIFTNASLPFADETGGCRVAPSNPERRAACPRIGNINLPVDMRQIPLVTRTGEDGAASSESLALATVSAFEDATDRRPRTRDRQQIADAITRGDFLFASFIPEKAFQTIALKDLAAGTPAAKQLCRGRIIVVGGTWSADLGRGEEVDSYPTPVGKMRGMYLHANYIEALLDNRYSRGVPLWATLLIDFVAGAALYVLFHKSKDHRGSQLAVLIVLPMLAVASYIVFANLNMYLDFILPLGAYFVHLTVEYVRDYIDLSRGREARSYAQSNVHVR